jgi:hypothetical protein
MGRCSHHQHAPRKCCALYLGGTTTTETEILFQEVLSDEIANKYGRMLAWNCAMISRAWSMRYSRV